MSHCTILDESALTTDVVRTGLSVKVHDKDFDEIVVYQIVNAPQASPLENRISDESPVGKALIGHRAGDTVCVELPDGTSEFVVLEISK